MFKTQKNSLAADAWLQNLPESHANYLSYIHIEKGRHPSAFLIYQNKTRFIKQIPVDAQGIEYSVLFWLKQLQLKSGSLFKAPPELHLPQPDVLISRPDLLITSKLAGVQLTKANVLACLPLINKSLVYIHNLIDVEGLPSVILKSINHGLPIKIDEVEPCYHEQFIQAKTVIDNKTSILSFIHGDLSAGFFFFFILKIFF